MFSVCKQNSVLLNANETGWHHHHILPSTSLSPLQGQATSSHCGNHWRNPSRPLGVGSHTGLHKCYIPCGVDAYTFPGRQSGLGFFPVFSWTGGRLAAIAFELENSIKCGRGGDGHTLWFGMRYRIRLIP